MLYACWRNWVDMEQRRKTIQWLFGCYCLMMLWLLLLRRMETGPGAVRPNWQPLDTVDRYLRVLRFSTSETQRQFAGANLIGNVLLFVPFGIFLPVLFGKMRLFFPFFLVALLSVIAVEACQLVTGLGACDVDDVLLNMTGITLGWLGWRLCRSHKKTE